ncbi:MAG: hypothetical protein Q4P24_10550 [Rhodobacterales bacterium]|nr:hypothetical protein [Rhodobacterales bacterium]
MARPRLHPLVRHAGSKMFPLLRTGLSVPAAAGFLRDYRTCQLYSGLGLTLNYDTPVHLAVADADAARRHAAGSLDAIPALDHDFVREILASMGDRMDKQLDHLTYAHHSHFCERLGTPPDDYTMPHPPGSFAIFALPEMMLMSGTYGLDLRKERREVWNSLPEAWPDLEHAPEITRLRNREDLAARKSTERLAGAVPDARDEDLILPVLVRPRNCYSNHSLLGIISEVLAFLGRIAPLAPQIGGSDIQHPVFASATS